MSARKNEDIFPSNFLHQPWIIQCHGANKHTTTFIDPMKRNIEEKEIVEMKGKLCFGCVGEWIFLWDEISKECFFLDLITLLKIHLPPLPKEDIIFSNFSLSSSPNQPNCVVILHGVKFDLETFTVQESFLMCCRPHDAKWNKIPLDQEIIGRTSVILDGKMYTCGIHCVYVFDVLSLLAGQVDSRVISTPNLAQYPRNDKIGRHLVKSTGSIYLVSIYEFGGGPSNYIDIYCLDTSSDEWLRVDNIGDRAFFLSNMCSVSVGAFDVGVERNCIYYVPFCYTDERRLYKFFLDDHTMTFTLAPIEETQYESKFCWFVLTRPKNKIMGSSVPLKKVSNEVNQDKIVMEKKTTINVCRPWNDLPTELVELLPTHLSLVDTLRLFTVCKGWNMSSYSIQRAKTWPWIMYQEKLDGACKLLDPLDGKEYTIRIGLPSSVSPTQMLGSKYGWVIMLDAANTMFMVNPLNQDVVKLPSLEEFDKRFCGITFTSVPTSSDCVVLGFCTNDTGDSIDFYKWRSGDEDWTIIHDNEFAFSSAANTNPVFFHEELYCLAETGELRVFSLIEGTWRMLNKTKSVYLENEVPFRGTHDCYLLELDGNLLSVFKYNYGDNDIRIFKLDRLKMEWVPVKDLAGWTLFLDPIGSFAKPSLHKSCSNKIFFTSFHSGTTKTCVAYCMESKRYDSSFWEAKKPLNCVWFEPNLIRKSL